MLFCLGRSCKGVYSFHVVHCEGCGDLAEIQLHTNEGMAYLWRDGLPPPGLKLPNCQRICHRNKRFYGCPKLKLYFGDTKDATNV